MQKNKIITYDVIKVIATILVVFAHVTRMYSGVGIITPLNSSVFLKWITELIYSFHMPLFIFVSGSIYYNLKIKREKYRDNKKFILNKFTRLIIPYLSVGIVCVAPVMVFYDFTHIGFFEYIVKGIIFSLNSCHLWYLLMLFNVFIIFQFGHKYISKFPKFTLIVFLICYCISAKIPAFFQLHNTFAYIIYFYIGYLFEKNEGFKSLNGNSKLLIVINFIVLTVFNYFAMILNMELLSKIIIALLGISLVYLISNCIKYRVINNKVFKELSKNSFGIYLFHAMIIYLMFYYLGMKNINPFLLTFIVFSLSLILSNFITNLIRKLKLNFIIGEKKEKEKIGLA